MNKLTRLIFLTGYLLSLGILAWVTSCQSDTAQPTYQKEAVEKALEKADSIPISGLYALAQSLPGTTEQDSFFAMYLSNMSATKGLDSLAAALPIFEKLRGKEIFTQSFIFEHKGLIHQLSGRFDSAEHYYTRSISLWENTPERGKYAEALHVRATLYNAMGNLESGIIDRYKAVEVLQNALDKPNLTAAEKGNLESTLLEIRTFFGNDFIKKKEYQKALDVLEAPTAYYLENNDVRMAALCLTTAGVAYENLNNLPKAYECCQKSMDLLRPAGIQSQLGVSLNNYAKLLQVEEKWQQALDTLKVAKVIFEKLNNPVALSRINFNMGRSQARLGQMKEAEDNFQFAYTVNDQRKDYPLLLSVCNEMVQLYKLKGDFAAALNFQEKAIVVSDSIMNEEKEKITKNLEIKYETREKQAQIAALKMEKQLADQRNAWIAAFLLSLAGAGAWFLRYRHRREKALLEKDIATKHLENEVLAKGLENKRLENEVLLANENLNRQTLENAAHEIEIHKAQLEEFVALMLEKNTKIEALQSKIEQASLPDESNAPRQNTPKSDDIDALFQASLVTETDWQFFQKHFEKVFPGILNRLKIQYPELSIAEHRLVLLSKMGLKTKETAGMLGISPESVRKLRYRFKKKMGLSEEELLDRVAVKEGMRQG
jgi:tetratricopeptide (TPR) repeat protein